MWLSCSLTPGESWTTRVLPCVLLNWPIFSVVAVSQWWHFILSRQDRYTQWCFCPGKTYWTRQMTGINRCCVCTCQAQAGDMSTVDFLKLLPSYVNETSCAVWQSLVECLRVIDCLLSNTDTHENFKKFAVKLFLPTAMRLGYDPKEGECKTLLTVNH